MKKLMVLMAAMLCGASLFAQDIITKKDGTDIQAKVLEVGQSEISYKKYSNPDGPSYTLDIADILMITFENGDRDMFNVDSKKSALPQGLMTYNSWSGKISVGGVTIEKEMLGNYFTPDDLALFKSSQGYYVAAIILAIPSGVMLGLGAGYMIPYWISHAEPDDVSSTMQGVFWAGVVGCIGTFVLDGIGSRKRQTAINNYNQSLSYRPELRIGATQNGIGLAYRF